LKTKSTAQVHCPVPLQLYNISIPVLHHNVKTQHSQIFTTSDVYYNRFSKQSKKSKTKMC